MLSSVVTKVSWLVTKSWDKLNSLIARQMRELIITRQMRELIFTRHQVLNSLVCQSLVCQSLLCQSLLCLLYVSCMSLVSRVCLLCVSFIFLVCLFYVSCVSLVSLVCQDQGLAEWISITWVWESCRMNDTCVNISQNYAQAHPARHREMVPSWRVSHPQTRGWGSAKHAWPRTL